jgi:hypothetical protein
MLSAEDYDAELAERYGWINRALPAEALGNFVRSLAHRIVHIFIDFGQLCSSKPTARVHGNRTAVFMISTTCFQAGQHT